MPKIRCFDCAFLTIASEIRDEKCYFCPQVKRLIWRPFSLQWCPFFQVKEDDMIPILSCSVCNKDAFYIQFFEDSTEIEPRCLSCCFGILNKDYVAISDLEESEVKGLINKQIDLDSVFGTRDISIEEKIKKLSIIEKQAYDKIKKIGRGHGVLVRILNEEEKGALGKLSNLRLIEGYRVYKKFLLRNGVTENKAFKAVKLVE